MNYMHWLFNIRTYDPVYGFRKKPAPNPVNNTTDREEDTVTNVSHADEERTASIVDNDQVSIRSESVSSVGQGHPESLQLVPSHNTGSPRPESTGSATPRGSAESSHTPSQGVGEEAGEEAPPTDERKAWLPFYLRRYVYIIFAVILGVLVAALEALFAVSQRRQGLVESHTGLHYLWTYAPTAVLTLIQAYWGRVDYEAKVTAPWLRADPICTSRDALLLDYVDMFPLAVPFKALKRRDYPVAASATISLLFTVLIVLSTGLFILSPIEMVDTPVLITLTTEFIDDPARLVNPSTLSYNSLASVLANYSYPDGTSDKFAYQSFMSNAPGVSETHATVEGMYLKVDCAQATLESIEVPRVVAHAGTHYFWQAISNFSVEYGGCHAKIPFNFCLALDEVKEGYFNLTQDWTTEIGPQYFIFVSPMNGLSPGKCASQSPDDRRLVFMTAELDYKLASGNATEWIASESSELEFDVTIVQSAALVCTVDYGITPVDVVRNATGVKSVSRHDDSPPRKFSDIESWDVLDPSYHFSGDEIGEVEYPGRITGNYGSSLIKASSELLSLPFSFLLNATNVGPLIVRFYQTAGVFVLQQSIMNSVHTSSTATATRLTYRLVVQSMSCQWMVSIMVLMMLVLVALSLIPQKALPSSIEPGSILATAALAGHLTTSCFPRNLGATGVKDLEKKLASWSESANVDAAQDRDSQADPTRTLKPVSPIVLSLAFRVTIFVLIASCVAALEVMLQTSVRHQGIWDIQDETYLHYAWTIIPATIVSLLSLSLSAISSQTRLLAPYHSLIRAAPLSSSLDMDLLRPLMPRVLYQEIKARRLDALATSVAALVSAAFTISVAALFQLEIFSVTWPVGLQTTSTLTETCDVTRLLDPTDCPGMAYADWSDPMNSEGTLIAGEKVSLVLETNLSYTSLSYENLVFPGFTLDRTITNDVPVSENTTIQAVVPAVRPGLSCRWYADSDITARFNDSDTVVFGFTSFDGIAVNITGEECAMRKNPYIKNTAVFPGELSADGYFGWATDYLNDGYYGCSAFLYIWGRISLGGPPTVWTSAVGCNATTETVDVAVSFVGPRLQLDPSQPPRPIESTSQSYDVYHPTAEDLYAGLASLPWRGNKSLLDSFFEQLVTSRYAIPISDLGDPSRAQTVKDAIAFQHGIIEAQYLSQFGRLNAISQPGNLSVPTLFPSLSTRAPTKDTGAYPAVAEDPYGRQRLVQDPTATRVAEALLLAALALSLLGWCLGPRKPVLPRSPTSVASVMALLAGGDILGHVYRDGEGGGGGNWQTIEDARAALPKDSKFWLGWGPPGTSTEEKKRRFAIWMASNPGETLSSQV
ncbi:hypothetical protein GGR52DRAFT_568296 [Hypoxylon sp. FL1284]|nr:hypothetical protein GGR52DRAFT_568296 [Hypoxylon sp. FL1284]